MRLHPNQPKAYTLMSLVEQYGIAENHVRQASSYQVYVSWAISRDKIETAILELAGLAEGEE